MSLAKAAVLFRALGLRHLLVVPKTPGVRPLCLQSFNILLHDIELIMQLDFVYSTHADNSFLFLFFMQRPPIVGILTRHDLMPEHILGLFPNLHKSH
jgi:chloride channel 7